MRMVEARADSPLATTCTMTEETRELARGAPGDPARSGGRLKFFKDGKFILELVRSGCSGEGGGGGGWVSVPRKTFWPPAAAPPGTPPHAHVSAPHPPHHARTDRATSLSVSDDNSSVQSSPWQRDHCWKQSTPRKNISKELALYYCRPSNLLNATISSASRTKRRRPYDVSYAHSLSNGSKQTLSNGVCADKARNGTAESNDAKCSRGDDAVDGSRLDTSTANSSKSSGDDVERWMDRERYYHMKLKKPYQYRKLRVYKKCRPPARRKRLLTVVDKLREKTAALPAPVNAKIANCRQEHAMVSPRKRILRELERVSLEDQGGKRRAKTVPALSTASYPPSPGPSHAAHKPPETPPARSNGAASSSARREAPKHVSSYSIHSLLSMPDDSPPESKRYTPSLKTESPSSVHSPDLSPSPDNYRYRHSLALGSPGGAGPAPRDSPTPPRTYLSAPYSTPPYPPRSRASPQYYGATQYRGSPARDLERAAEWRDGVYLYGGYAPPFLPPHLYRTPPPPPPPMWVHYMSPGIPPGPWAPLAHPLVTHHIPKEEPSSDLPLNLSKH